MKIRLTNGSGTVDLKYLVQDVDRHGNVRVYFRRRGEKKVRLIAKLGTPEFMEEYERALRGAPRPNKTSPSTPAASGTMRWLCQQYFQSAAFKALGETTRKVRRGILESICVRAGNFQFRDMQPRHVARLRDEKADFPESANSRVKALRQLFNWACSAAYRYAEHNPANQVEYLKSKNPGGFKEWTEEEVAQFEVRHPIGTKARLALDLFLYTGVRRSDVVKLGPQFERNGKLCFEETKGRSQKKKEHEIPILPPLRASIDATPSGHLAYLVTEFGHPHSVKAFGNWFKKRCREAGLPEACSAHGLRKAGARRCAEAGATEHQLMALFGWTTPRQAAHYTKGVNRVRLETEAVTKLLPARNSNQSVPLSSNSETGGTLLPKKR